MNLNHYELKAGKNLATFEFLSVGRKGQITKVIQFQKMDYPNLYNLAFGDKNAMTGKIDDMSISDNGDLSKVLATVVAAIYIFTDSYTRAWIYAIGSTAERTRLFRMGINKYFDIAKTDFEILGKYFNEWDRYEKNKNYDAFAIRRKMNKFEE